MTAPAFRVRVAWTTDPFSGSPSWTDESTRVSGVSFPVQITRGQDTLYNQTQPSTLSLLFKNNDGRFTPRNASSALYPNVVRGKRIRIDATVDGTNYFNRFDGYLDTLPVQWGAATTYSEAQFTAVDRLAQLGHQLVSDNIVSLYYEASSPTDYWDLGDPDGTIHPRNRTGATVLTADGTTYSANQSVTWGSGTGVGTDGLSAVEIVDTDLVTTGTVGNLQATNEGFFRASGAVSTDDFRIVQYAGASAFGSTQYFVLGVQGGVAVVYFSDITPSPVVEVFGTTSVIDGATHHIASTWDGTTLTLYVDGVSQGSTTPGFFSFPAVTLQKVAASVAIHANPPTATFDHIATFPTALSGSDIANHANAGLNGFSGETSAQRFTRICGFAGITPVVTGTSGTQSMGPLSDIKGQSILDLLQAVQDTENGAFFTQTDGDIQLVPRVSFYNMSASMTLTAGQYGTDLQFIVDNSQLVNDAIGTGSSGLPQEATNATSITANGTYSASKSLNTTNDAEVLGWAQLQVNTDYTVPRVAQVTLDLWAQQSLCVTAWGLDIGNRLDLSGLPSTAPSSSVQLQIDGYTESFGLGAYTITFNTSPLPAQGWVLGDSTLGKLGTTSTLAY